MKQNVLLPKYLTTKLYCTTKYIEYFSGTSRNDSWKSNGMSKENIKIKLNQTAILDQLSFITRHKI